MKPCPICGKEPKKAIYMGLPGRFCPDCSCLDGLAACAPPVVTETDDGPMFAFFIYEGGYWPALWAWLKGDTGEPVNRP